MQHKFFLLWEICFKLCAENVHKKFLNSQKQHLNSSPATGSSFMNDLQSHGRLVETNSSAGNSKHTVEHTIILFLAFTESLGQTFFCLMFSLKNISRVLKQTGSECEKGSVFFNQNQQIKWENVAVIKLSLQFFTFFWIFICFCFLVNK